MPFGHRYYKVFLYSRGREIKEFGRHRGLGSSCMYYNTLAFSYVQSHNFVTLFPFNIIYCPFPVIHCLSNINKIHIDLEVKDLYYHPCSTTLLNTGDSIVRTIHA